jgi:hypothetical protein
LTRKTRHIAAAALALPLAGLLTVGAAAAPLSPPAAVSGSTGHVVLAHGCHSSVQLGVRGWHFHTRTCRRIATRPPLR